MKPTSIYINSNEEIKTRTYDESKCIKLIQKYNLLIECYSDNKSLIFPGTLSCEIGRLGMMLVGSFKEQHFTEIKMMKQHFIELDKSMKINHYSYDDERTIRMMLGIYCSIQKLIDSYKTESLEIQSRNKKLVVDFNEDHCYTFQYLIGLYEQCRLKLKTNNKSLKELDHYLHQIQIEFKFSDNEIYDSSNSFERFIKSLCDGVYVNNDEKNNFLATQRILDYCHINFPTLQNICLVSKEDKPPSINDDKKYNFDWMNEVMESFHSKYYENIISIISYYDLISVNDFDLFLNLHSNNKNIILIHEWISHIQQIQFTIEMIVCCYGKNSFKRMPYYVKSMIEVSNCFSCILAAVTINMIIRISSERTISPSIKLYNLSLALVLQEIVKILIPFTSNFKMPNKKIDEVISQSLRPLSMPKCNPPLYSFERIRLEEYKSIIKSYLDQKTSLTPMNVMKIQSYAIYLRVQYGFDPSTISLLSALDEITTSYEYFGFLPSILPFIQCVLPLINQSPACCLGYAPSCLGIYEPEKVILNRTISNLTVSDGFNISILLNNIHLANTLSLVYSHCFHYCEFSSIELMNGIKKLNENSFKTLNIKDMYGISVENHFMNVLVHRGIDFYGMHFMENALFPLYSHSLVSSLNILFHSHQKHFKLSGLLPICYFLEKNDCTQEELLKLINTLKTIFCEDCQIKQTEIESSYFDKKLSKAYLKSIITIIQ
ncbi:hypothetical protein EHI8A_021590 [Entamoeba histolytica HM-1:IMSS-B]|uniref:Uncharacterized protein n=6 Tax=Entamoeba histolytica TaxID=5759 RepID=C4M3W7_ENTH1|nr:hypothetical protein EHI_016450 [Entamoeba histolytica HM-1:IMSS]EMD48547.1 Hypothetical protein EHI5A_042860 [Entamoeba histolytica KU27]EMH72837.1 hypothetical protein EHI8A_021590 [Entamoeba histolytica HM-1:IMSS-B]EMS15837.1 hypothetical protein KM1_053520 [Entamoeba histolytica HM-3:IMSS]ENY61006.1 hypothetical protein EHI7A_023230 [Entamoeba histolytica HM-1:IMSS-A]GAT96033.1 hypothetical protein CL6EHI_016450 [Entamoeba histolytica]|eukprot:XP_653522.1 hypothetical protein EHI_016450 [Entamoeba histolytica HM-1:IMSS]